MNKGSVIINLDERWSLEDFSVFSKQYIQVYGFFFALRKLSEVDSIMEFERMPWLGGASVVHFFTGMKNHIHPDLLPNVQKIQYASPGFMELSAIVEVADDIKNLVLAMCSTVGSIATTYHVIHSQYRSRQLAQKKMRELENSEDKNFVRNSVLELHEQLNLSPQQVVSLSKISKGDQLVELKMLMAMYRRAKPIADLQAQNKAQL
ncbi:hypothetical protein [Photobacterium leiognathi]|uniref:hypothetical protein n=2 Tax=Photobacterium leiognathi TaxID=553611 RepID=UPI000D17B330|nr:hypothetical protein [Photobacterium leiognathi]PSW57888.1 hypothetical protein C0W50_07305 [Photobacterium leiognathi subsp. mandapamensis]